MTDDVKNNFLDRTVGTDLIAKTKDVNNPEALYEELIGIVKKYHPSDNTEIIERAYKLASEAHGNQVRKSGAPYITHPLHVAIILADLKADKETIVAGLLHDVIEDTKFTYEDIKEMFGEDVADLVQGVTKVKGGIDAEGKQGEELLGSADRRIRDNKAKTYRNMMLATAKDIRVIYIKLADRLHNMRTLKFMSPKKQIEIATETWEIYAPIANKLGISKIKVELDDLGLKYLKPKVYDEIKTKLALKVDERWEFIKNITKEIEEELKKAGIKARVSGRAKHFFSIYKKMQKKNKKFEELDDLFAVRVIIDSPNPNDTYIVFGLIHSLYDPIEDRMKDYVARPKSNGYSSLHTTVLSKDCKRFEVQIRTEQMHAVAEYGRAAHWVYKESGDGSVAEGAEANKINSLKELLKLANEELTDTEYMEEMKDYLNLFNDYIYCYTPKGMVLEMPMDATPIDFAYRIHSAVGNKMVGAKVNNSIVNFDYKLQMHDTVEIITSQNSLGPKRDWLKIVKEVSTKTKIEQWFRHQYKEENIEKGRELLKKCCRDLKIEYDDITKKEYIDRAVRKYSCDTWETLLSSVGHGGLEDTKVVTYLNERHKDFLKGRGKTDEELIELINRNASKIKPVSKSSGLSIENISSAAIRYANCCQPVPGDEIVAFVTRGRGYVIHRTDCANYINMTEADKVRVSQVTWTEKELNDPNVTYQAGIKVLFENRNGVISDIMTCLKDMGISVGNVNAYEGKGIDKVGHGIISVYVHNKEELNTVCNKILNIKSVIKIERSNT